MRKKSQPRHPRILPTKPAYLPVIPNDGDEIYRNGLVLFNITALLAWLEEQTLPIVQVPADKWGLHYEKAEEYVLAADLSRPIILAEIAPDRFGFVPCIPEDDWTSRGYMCIDGYHRIEKARRMGIEILPAVILRMEQHIPFIYKGYSHYAEYWNQKLNGLQAENRDPEANSS